jgi:hypothetical protein
LELKNKIASWSLRDFLNKYNLAHHHTALLKLIVRPLLWVKAGKIDLLRTAHKLLSARFWRLVAFTL